MSREQDVLERCSRGPRSGIEQWKECRRGHLYACFALRGRIPTGAPAPRLGLALLPQAGGATGRECRRPPQWTKPTWLEGIDMALMTTICTAGAA